MPACGYKFTSGETCSEEALPASSYCIFHETMEEKERLGMIDECMKEFYKKMDEGQTDFEGYKLANVDLSEKVITQVMDFRDAVFAGEADFIEVIFNQEAYFMGATFQKADFSKATFQEADFMGATFQKADFMGATFQKAGFTCTTFQKAGFVNATFQSVSFISATFQKADFAFATFQSVSFASATFQKADFSKATFLKAFFSEVTFLEADFTGATIDQEASFWDAIFERRGTFEDAYIVQADFENAELRHVSFRGVDVSNFKFYKMRASNCYFGEAIWPTRRHKFLWTERIVREEREARESDKAEDYRKAEEVYRYLQKNLKTEEVHALASEFEYREKLMRLEAMRREEGRLKERFWSRLKWATTGFMEKPMRVLLMWAIVILSFGVIYWLTDGITRSGAPVDILDNFYFSVVTFTTLGFGDIQPVANIGYIRVCAMTEALLGAMLMALFILVLGRKMMR